MSPYVHPNAREATATSAKPSDAADFVGQWIDSLGNDVYVELVNGSPKVTLMKTYGRPLELWLFFDNGLQGWRCGNGLLSETVFGSDKSGKTAKVLQFAAWVTKDGRVSTWTRALAATDETPEPPTIVKGSRKTRALARRDEAPAKPEPPTAVRGSHYDREVAQDAPAPRLLGAAPQTTACQAAPIEASRPAEEDDKDGVQISKSSRFQRSWYDMTEDWDKTDGPQEFAGGREKHVEGVPESESAVKEGKTGRTRRGRRRAGRGKQL